MVLFMFVLFSDSNSNSRYWCFNLFNDDAIFTYISSCAAVIQASCSLHYLQVYPLCCERGQFTANCITTWCSTYFHLVLSTMWVGETSYIPLYCTIQYWRRYTSSIRSKKYCQWNILSLVLFRPSGFSRQLRHRVILKCWSWSIWRQKYQSEPSCLGEIVSRWDTHARRIRWRLSVSRTLAICN